MISVEKPPIDSRKIIRMDTKKTGVTNVKPGGSELFLPYGLIGFPEFNDVEIVYAADELPFMRMRELKEDELEFLVLEPYGLFPDYNIELSVEDSELLDIKSDEDVYLLNIVTVHNDSTHKVTVNLVAPLIFNKRTLQGKQVIIKNFKEHSAQHILHEEKEDSK